MKQNIANVQRHSNPYMTPSLVYILTLTEVDKGNRRKATPMVLQTLVDAPNAK